MLHPRVISHGDVFVLRQEPTNKLVGNGSAHSAINDVGNAALGAPRIRNTTANNAPQ